MANVVTSTVSFVSNPTLEFNDVAKLSVTQLVEEFSKRNLPDNTQLIANGRSIPLSVIRKFEVNKSLQLQSIPASKLWALLPSTSMYPITATVGKVIDVSTLLFEQFITKMGQLDGSWEIPLQNLMPNVALFDVVFLFDQIMIGSAEKFTNDQLVIILRIGEIFQFNDSLMQIILQKFVKQLNEVQYLAQILALYKLAVKNNLVHFSAITDVFNSVISRLARGDILENKGEFSPNFHAFLTQISALRPIALTLEELSLNANGLSQLANIIHFASLCIQLHPDITDEDLHNLESLSSIQCLDMNSCGNVTDAGLQSIAHLTSLQRLRLTKCAQITDAGLESLSHLTSLKILDLTACINITDLGLRHLLSLTNLEGLCCRACQEITDTGLELLSNLTSLHVLILDGCINITNFGLLPLSHLTALQTLDLSCNCHITTFGIRSVFRIVSLQELFLNGCSGISHKEVTKLKSERRTHLRNKGLPITELSVEEDK